ncbi:thioredoxin domain-containing protein [Patescibacteria group bacterium]|nr:thioredoxin domain-containing protein [Patescibacteria group bacterium]
MDNNEEQNNLEELKEKDTNKNENNISSKEETEEIKENLKSNKIKDFFTKSNNKINFERIFLIFSSLGFLVFLFLYLNTVGLFSNISIASSYNGEKVKVDLYAMSQCPYGVEAMNTMDSVLDSMGEVIDYNINYIVNLDDTGNLTSLHGDPEVKGNIVELCAKEYAPDKYLDMISCMNESYSEIPDNWRDCAAESFITSLDQIKTCYEGEEGEELLKENMKKANELQVAASPTFYINDEKYQSARDEVSIKRFLCSQIDYDYKACFDIPACVVDSDCVEEADKIGKCITEGDESYCEYYDPETIDLTILNDERCEDCAFADQVVASLSQIFKGLNIEKIDYNTEEGKKIYEENDLEFLPSFLFAENVKGGEGYQNVQNYLYEKGEYLELAVGSEFNPSLEICDNSKDDTGNGLVDCLDPDCSSALVCRQEIAKNLDVFVMSDCPYGTQALDALKEVNENFKDDNININVNYIGDHYTEEEFNNLNDIAKGMCEQRSNDKYYCSLHGGYEVEEDIRSLCVNNYYPDKFLEYTWCRIDQGIKDGDYAECFNGRMDVATIDNCVSSSEGTYLFEQNTQIAKDLNIGASPTWVVNNKYEESGVDANAIKQAFCKYNLNIEACENELSSTATSADASCS